MSNRSGASPRALRTNIKSGEYSRMDSAGPFPLTRVLQAPLTDKAIETDPPSFRNSKLPLRAVTVFPRRGASPLPQIDDPIVNRADCPPDDSAPQSPIEEAHDTAPPRDRVAHEVVGEQLQMLTDMWTILDE